MLADVLPDRPVKGPPCSVCQALRDLPEVEADALQAMMRNRKWTHRRISEALDSECGIYIPHYTIGNHVRGDCKARLKYRP